MKIKTFSILTAALLSLSMLLVSCDKAQTNNEPTETQPTVQGVVNNTATATTTVGKVETEDNGLSYQLHTVIDGGEQFYAVYGMGSSKAAELVIPASYKEIPVKAIGSSAFRGSKLLTSVTVPDSVTSIGDMAFENCDSLKTVTLGNGVESIGKRAFGSCDLLSTVSFGSGLKTVGYEAFYSCVLLTEASLPQGMNEIGERAFWSCYKLEKVTLGDQLSSIGRDAFYACGSIKYTEENGVFYLGNDSNPHLYLAGFSDRAVTTYTVHNDTKYIGQGAFSNCEALTTVILPAGITVFAEASFEYCPVLTSIQFQGTQEAWGKINKAYLWDYGTGNYTVTCLDGSLIKG